MTSGMHNQRSSLFRRAARTYGRCLDWIGTPVGIGVWFFGIYGGTMLIMAPL